MSVRKVLQTSRGLDLLETMSKIDRSHIGFVGRSMGTLPAQCWPG